MATQRALKVFMQHVGTGSVLKRTHKLSTRYVPGVRIPGGPTADFGQAFELLERPSSPSRFEKDGATQRNCLPANEKDRCQRNIRVHAIDTENNTRQPTKSIVLKPAYAECCAPPTKSTRPQTDKVRLPTKTQRRRRLFVASTPTYLT